ncbi:MAG: cation:proton antiporter [Spirochaetota bacterium]
MLTEFIQHLALIDFLRIHPLFAIGSMLILGYVLARISETLGLPEITGFIVAGLIMGSGGLAVLGSNASEDLSVITEVALGLIALTIGGELRLSKLRRVLGSVAWITVGQFVLPFLLVSSTLIFLQTSTPFALLLGVVATTTSPAAIVAVVQSTRARGTIIDSLYGTVALGDALSVAAFGIVLSLAPSLLGASASATQLMTTALLDVGMSLVIGGAFGFFIYVSTRSQNNSGEVMILSLGFLFLSTTTAIVLDFSPLLVNMAAGAALTNVSPRSSKVFRTLEPFTPPVYALFFVIAGTKLNPSLLFSADILLFGIFFVIARWAGKYSGAYIGSRLSGASPAIRRYLGLGLFAQAGIALGLVVLLQTATELHGLENIPAGAVETSINIVLFSVFVNEITGPPIAKFAIQRALTVEA